jgi:hypothetical protein
MANPRRWPATGAVTSSPRRSGVTTSGRTARPRRWDGPPRGRFGPSRRTSRRCAAGPPSGTTAVRPVAPALAGEPSVEAAIRHLASLRPIAINGLRSTPRRTRAGRRGGRGRRHLGPRPFRRLPAPHARSCAGNGHYRARRRRPCPQSPAAETPRRRKPACPIRVGRTRVRAVRSRRRRRATQTLPATAPDQGRAHVPSPEQRPGASAGIHRVHDLVPHDGQLPVDRGRVGGPVDGGPVNGPVDGGPVSGPVDGGHVDGAFVGAFVGGACLTTHRRRGAPSCHLISAGPGTSRRPRAGVTTSSDPDAAHCILDQDHARRWYPLRGVSRPGRGLYRLHDLAT